MYYIYPASPVLLFLCYVCFAPILGKLMIFKLLKLYFYTIMLIAYKPWRK